MRWRALLCLAFLAHTDFLGEALGQRRSRQPPAYFKALESLDRQSNLARAVLRNGLTVVIEEYPVDPLATVATFVKAGYWNEDEAGQGSSRLLERLYLYRSGLAEKLADMGAIPSFRTDQDSMTFFSTGPAENVLEMLALHAELLKPLQLPADSGITGEMEILLQEGERRLRCARLRAHREISELAGFGKAAAREGFSSHPIPDLKSALSLQQQVRRFHGSYYHPKNVILSVSGAVRRERILEKVVELYAAMKSREGSRLPWSDPSTASAGKHSFRYAHRRQDIPRPYILFSYRVPGRGHSDYYPLLLLSWMLGRSQGALLQSMVSQSESATHVEAGLEAFVGGGSFLILISPDPAKVDRAEVDVLAQLEALRRQGVPPAELDRAKALAVKDHYKGLQSLQGRAFLLARAEALGGYAGRDAVPQILAGVTSGEMERVLEKYFAVSNLALLEYFPAGTEARTFTAESLLETLQLLVSTAVVEKSDALQSQQAAQPDPAFRLPEFTPTYFRYERKKTSVLRGPEIYLQESHVTPLVHLMFVFPGGRSNESAETAGLTELMLWGLLRNWASRETSLSWSALEQRSAELNVVNEPDFFGFQVTVLSPHLATVFGTLAEWLRSPDLKEEDLQWARRKVRSLLASHQEKEFLRLLDLTRGELFGEHPYGLSRYGTADRLSEFKLEDVRDWMQGQISRVHPLMVVRGDIKGTSFLQDFVSELSDPRYEVRRIVRDEREGEEEQIAALSGPVFKDGPGQVVIGFSGPARGTREQVLLNVLQDALLGPGGPLFLKLHEEAPALHQVTMFQRPLLREGAVFAHLWTERGGETAAREQFLTYLREYEKTPLRRKNFPAALVTGITRFYLQQQAVEEDLIGWTGNILAGKGVEYREDYLSIVKSASPEDFMHLVKDYFGERKQTDAKPRDVQTTDHRPQTTGPQAEEQQPQPERRGPTLRKKDEP